MKTAIFYVAFALLLVRPALAQEGAPPDHKAEAPQTIAVLPWTYLHGTNGAKATAKEFLATVLTKSHIEALPEARVTTAWDADASKHGRAEDAKSLPTPKDLLQLGKALGVDYVMAGRADWHTKSVWIGFGPKTKSDCTVDMMIVDVKKGEIALDAKAVRMDSTAKEDALKAAGTVLLTPLFTVVSGGPKTPHEQRAVQLAIAKAISPWLATRPHNVKIQ